MLDTVKTDVQAVLVLIFIVHDVLAVIHDEFRNFPNVHHLVVLPIWIPGPVGVVVYLNVGDCTTRINSNTVGIGIRTNDLMFILREIFATSPTFVGFLI